MFSSQDQTLPEPLEEPIRTWKKSRHQHPEFKREEYSIVPFEDKILIVGGYLEDSDERATNLLLLDPENQSFQIIPSVGNDVESCCSSRMSACYWKDSKVVVFGGYDYYAPSKYSPAVAVITLKDLDSENPSAHWERMVTPTELLRYRHQAHIHENKMYICGGSDDNGQAKYDIWCLDLTEWTWSKFNFTFGDDRQDTILEGSFTAFYKNKAFVFLWQNETHEGIPLMEIDVDTRSSIFFLFPDFRKNCLSAKFCLQPVNGKLLFVLAFTDSDPNQPKLELRAYDLFLRNWTEIKTTEPAPNLTDLLSCNNHLVCSGKFQDDSDEVFFEVWSLPLNTPKTNLTTTLSKTQQTLKDFLFEAPYSDISFEVGSEVIKAHKWWLIQRNKFFANMFASGMSEAQASTIRITDMKASTFKALLEFLYTDHVELDNSLALDLLHQADKYSIGELKNACEKHLMANIEPENYVALGQIAELIGAGALREAVVTFIAKNMKEVKQRKDFNEISDALLRDSLVKFIVK